MQNNLRRSNIDDESAYIWHIGESGNVLINEDADRLKGYYVWNYAEGSQVYYRSMHVDLTQPSDKVTGVVK